MRAAPVGPITLDYATMPDFLGPAAIALGQDSRLEISVTGAPAPEFQPCAVP